MSHLLRYTRPTNVRPLGWPGRGATCRLALNITPRLLPEVIHEVARSRSHRVVEFPRWQEGRPEVNRFAMDMVASRSHIMVSIMRSPRDVYLASALNYTHIIYDSEFWNTPEAAKVYHSITDDLGAPPYILSVVSIPELYRKLHLEL